MNPSRPLPKARQPSPTTVASLPALQTALRRLDVHTHRPPLVHVSAEAAAALHALHKVT
jgi:hypothetical protein